MNWENILKQPELEQPPMEEPLMEEPMVDPTTGLPLDPMAQQAGMAVPPQTPANPNPTGEEEFPVDPEVEDDANLNKWFSTVKKQTNPYNQPTVNPAAVDPNKKKQEAEAAALREKLAGEARAKQASQRIQADFQRRAKAGAKAAAKANRKPLVTSVPQGTVNPDAPIEAAVATGKKVLGGAKQLGSRAVATAADSAAGRKLRETGKGIKQGLVQEKDVLVSEGKNLLDAGKKVVQTGQQVIANPKGAVREARKGTKQGWKDAVKRRNERVYGGYDSKQQQKEAKEKERIANRKKLIGERLKVQQEQQASGASKPRQYTDPETGEVKDMERGYADTGIQEYDISRSESSLGEDDQEKFFQFKDASDQLGINWKKYKSQAGYRSKMQNDLKNKYNITADDITRFQDKVSQGSLSGEKVQPRLLTEEERVEAFKDREEGRSVTSASLQKQDRRDDPALWESWDGGL